jgi:hypothetical protein
MSGGRKIAGIDFPDDSTRSIAFVAFVIVSGAKLVR